jgi:hypothetical protein
MFQLQNCAYVVHMITFHVCGLKFIISGYGKEVLLHSVDLQGNMSQNPEVNEMHIM